VHSTEVSARAGPRRQRLQHLVQRGEDDVRAALQAGVGSGWPGLDAYSRQMFCQSSSTRTRRTVRRLPV